MEALGIGAQRILERADFPALLAALQSSGYRVVGPTLRDGAIVYGEIRQEEDLPIGWTDHQGAGKYRLEKRTDQALFGYNVGPHSWKKFLFPSRERLWTATRSGTSFTVFPEKDDGPPMAFLGVRACELAGLDVSDAVFDRHVHDPGYHARRAKILKIAVQCGQAGGTCFCVSMKTGPGVKTGHDLALTEILTKERHYFLVEVGSAAGAAVLGHVPLHPAEKEDTEMATTIVARTAASMGRTLDTDGVHDLLLKQPDHPRWEAVARRCLSCTNCTMVCPTCFCSTTEEVPDLNGETVEKWRRWDSCFNLEFTQLHTASVRKSTLSRYRQWLTHKLASWEDQFGTSGCVGCGRCITWCPVGIDLTEEVAAIRATPSKAPPAGGSA
jgi:sulfhydrogenase subunit beta (sulfur reductase)